MLTCAQVLVFPVRLFDVIKMGCSIMIDSCACDSVCGNGTMGGTSITRHQLRLTAAQTQALNDVAWIFWLQFSTVEGSGDGLCIFFFI